MSPPINSPKYEVWITEDGGVVNAWIDSTDTFREARDLLLEQVDELMSDANGPDERREYRAARTEIAYWQRNNGNERTTEYNGREFGIRGPL